MSQKPLTVGDVFKIIGCLEQIKGTSDKEEAVIIDELIEKLKKWKPAHKVQFNNLKGVRTLHLFCLVCTLTNRRAFDIMVLTTNRKDGERR